MLDNLKFIKIPSWDCYFMSLAFLASSRSKDPSTKVGAVLVFPDKSYVTGYNGLPSAFNDEILNTPEKYDVVRHAEENALDFAGLSRCRQEHPTLYVTFRPCPKCATKLVHFGIPLVIYHSEYESKINNQILLEKVCRMGYLNEPPRLTLTKYSAEPLLFYHEHVGIKSL